MPRTKEQPNKDGYYRRTMTAKDGKRIYGRSKKSNADALRDANEKLEQYEQGNLLLKDMTVFRACANKWLDIEVRPNVSDKEYDTIEQRLKKFVFPILGGRPISMISSLDVQVLLTESEIKSKSMITKIRQYISRIYKFAIIHDITNKNPVVNVKTPKREEGQRRPLTQLERDAFLKASETHRGGLWVLTMMYCGLRRGETVPLTWDDIDIDNGIITINKAVSFYKQKIIIKEPKTKSGFRTVRMPQPLLDKFKEIKKADRTGLIFPAASGKMMTYTAVRTLWSSFILAANKAAGAQTFRGYVPVPVLDTAISPHYLRHTCAADLYRMGVDLKTAQAYLGHANIQTTANIYMAFEGQNDISGLQSKYYGNRAKNVPNKIYRIKRRVDAKRKNDIQPTNF